MSNRELDAEVAEKVMGWSRTPASERNPNCCDKWHVGAAQLLSFAGPQCITNFDGYFQPSSEISAAMEVVEKMFADGWAVGMDRNIQDGKPLDFYGWSASFHGGNPRKGAYAEIEADTLPEAICRAALAALKTQVTNTSAADGTTQPDTAAGVLQPSPDVLSFSTAKGEAE